MQQRLIGLDAFRGAVLAVMILTPVTGDHGSYPHLAHAEWDGFTVSDAVLPSFLVASGASLALLLRPPLKAGTGLRLVRRFVALIVVGLAYNAVGAEWDLNTLRLTGVLQLIGISGAIAALVILGTRRLTTSLLPLAGIALVVPLLYGISLARSAPCSSPLHRCSPWFDLDVAVLGRSHLYRQGELRLDPEGLVVAIAASALVLIGAVAMEWVRTRGTGWRPLLALAGAGAALVGLGLLVGTVQPVVKRLHTPAFTFLAGGVGVLGLTLATTLWDTHPKWRLLPGWARRAGSIARRVVAHPLETLGRNALVVYFAERVLLAAANQTAVGTGSDPQTIQQVLVRDVLAGNGVRVHLAYTALLLALILGITYAMRALRWRIAL